jgi:hypothetical protein
MTTITLDDVVAEQRRLAALIETLQAGAGPTKMIIVPETAIELRAGEHYAGLVLKADGTPGHHVVLLPGEGEDLEWEEAKAWAIEAGGELPTRQEQALLYANLKAQFQPAWYWSSEPHETNSSYAWYQLFYDGSQVNYYKDYPCRARAVRRVAA